MFVITKEITNQILHLYLSYHFPSVQWQEEASSWGTGRGREIFGANLDVQLMLYKNKQISDISESPRATFTSQQSGAHYCRPGRVIYLPKEF